MAETRLVTCRSRVSDEWVASSAVTTAAARPARATMVSTADAVADAHAMVGVPLRALVSAGVPLRALAASISTALDRPLPGSWKTRSICIRCNTFS